MALLYRMGSGNGSGGDLKPFIINFTCDSGFIGKTVTMEFQGTPHAGETVDNVSGTVASDGTLTLYPMHDGLWKYYATSDVSGYQEKTITLEKWGNYPVELSDIPKGATVTPTDNIQTWLKCAELNKSYTTISQVLADTNTLSALISDNNASDYLVRSTTWASDICNNESAMTYIGLNDYCSDKLLADNTWLEAICNSPYIEKVLKALILPMTSNTGDDGGEAVVSAPYNNSVYPPYYAFDGNASTLTVFGLNNSISWLGYYFPSKVRVNRIGLQNYDNDRIIKFILQAFDGNDWINISNSIDNPTGNTLNHFNVSNNTYYNKYRILVVETANAEFWTNVAELQFYGREEA